MGVNTTIIVVKPLADNGLNIAKILGGLHLPAALEQEGLDFEDTLTRLSDPSSPGDIAATTYEGKVIFVDSARYIDEEAIPAFTTSYPAEVLQVLNSDTTDTGEFSFWKGGELLRKLSSGLDVWMNELDEMGIVDEEILSHFESVNIGVPLEFEKESSDPTSVLAAYALDYFAFYELRWAIFQIIR
jgi:hypothetical protein